MERDLVLSSALGNQRLILAQDQPGVPFQLLRPLGGDQGPILLAEAGALRAGNVLLPEALGDLEPPAEAVGEAGTSLAGCPNPRDLPYPSKQVRANRHHGLPRPKSRRPLCSPPPAEPNSSPPELHGAKGA